jgi:hypothetical protein
MPKSKKRRRKQALYEAATKAQKQKQESSAAPSSGKTNMNQQVEDGSRSRSGSTSSDNSSTLQKQLSESDLQTTIRTLQFFTADANGLEVFQTKRCKELRRALHPLIQEQVQAYDKGVDYRVKTTLALSHQKWSDALASLQGCKDFVQIPKQGTVQRWVRCVDLCMTPVKLQLLAFILSLGERKDEGQGQTAGRREEEEHDAAVSNTEIAEAEASDYVLNKHDPRLALIEAQQQFNKKEGATDVTPNDGLQVLEPWEIPSDHPNHPTKESPADTDDDAAKESNTDDAINLNAGIVPLKTSGDETTTIKSKIIYTEKGAERKPPNHYDLLLHATIEPGTIRFCADKSYAPVVKHAVPFVKGGFVLENVLTANECAQLQQVATQLGYRLDHPTSLADPTGIDSCEWLVDESIHSVLYDRVKEHLPTTMNNKNTNHLHSINHRWRSFRYGQDCVYRPHIDGSWPESRLSEDGKSYDCDEKGSTKSYLTFLMYLNDDFEGGQTRFYNVSSTGDGMTARGVVPKRGCVMVFPQGNTASLLHEGSAVTRGTKYVVRTDVLYSSSTSSLL